MTENKTRESQLRAVRKYKEKVNRITIDFHPSEAELWEHLKSQPKKATYIKNLIRKNMKGEEYDRSGVNRSIAAIPKRL